MDSLEKGKLLISATATLRQVAGAREERKKGQPSKWMPPKEMWRRGWDSNPRRPFDHSGFRVRRAGPERARGAVKGRENQLLEGIGRVPIPARHAKYRATRTPPIHMAVCDGLVEHAHT